MTMQIMPELPGMAVARIAADLMGAKLTTEFVKEVWANATPEAKAEISTALVKLVIQKLNDMPRWNVEDMAKGILAESLKDILSEHAILIREAIGKKVEVYTEQKITEIAQAVYMKVVDETSRDMVRKIEEALRGKH